MMKSALRGLFILVFTVTLAACGRGSTYQSATMIAPEDKRKLFTEPTEDLTPTTPIAKAYSVYNLVSAKFGPDAKAQSLSARVVVESTAGREVVDLVGLIRPDGSVSLVDMSPLKNETNRLIGEALCADVGICRRVILDIYYNVGGRTLKRQFLSEALKAEADADAAAPKVSAPPEPTVLPAEKGLTNETGGDDEKLGDFVGPARNENLVGKLWKRTETPELPTADVEAAATPAPSPTPTPTPVPEKKPAKPIPAPVPAPAPRRPLPVKPQPQPIPNIPGKPTAPAKPVEPLPSVTSSTYPFPPATPVPGDEELDQKMTLLEAKLAPLINLRDGGQAEGSYGYSRSPVSGIKGAMVLPSNILGLTPMTVTANAHWGSGMLVSFLENAATYLSKQLGLALFVGDMSLKKGGKYGGGSSHNTHRNGLDADIAYLGIAHPLHDSALTSRGQMVTGFNFEKTWTFLKLASKQELIEDAQTSTAISRVYMSHHVKDGFCAWAKEKGVLEDPANVEILRLIRRETNHHKHFHLSLKCSPHYPLCRNLAGPPPNGAGCP